MHMDEYDELITELVRGGHLITSRIIEGFRTIRRKDFIPTELEQNHAENRPLPIGYGQTISQPLTVAFMLELLQPREGDKILEIGSGSGWQTALLAHLVGPKGAVISMERIRPLGDFAQLHIDKYHFTNVRLIVGDGTRGYAREAPYDKIIVAAAAEEIPAQLFKQLAGGGILVMPVGNVEQDIVKMEKISSKEFSKHIYPGFQFVPLVPGEWGKNL